MSINTSAYGKVSFTYTNSICNEYNLGAVTGYSDIDTARIILQIANTLIFACVNFNGFHYDPYTKLYYAKDKVYDPEICRYLNAVDPGDLITKRTPIINSLAIDTSVSNVPVNNTTSNNASAKSTPIGTTPLNNNSFSYNKNNPVKFTDQSKNYKTGLVGVGIQIELSIGLITGGLEIIWYFSPRVNIGSRDKFTPYVYLYGGGCIGASAETKTVLNSIIKKPSLLFNPKSLVSGFSLSVCVFAIIGFSNFYSPSNYLKWFNEKYASLGHVKGYVSWCDTCLVVGAGWSSNYASCGYSKSYYTFASLFFDGIANLYGSVLNKAKSLNVGEV